MRVEFLKLNAPPYLADKTFGFFSRGCVNVLALAFCFKPEQWISDGILLLDIF